MGEFDLDQDLKYIRERRGGVSFLQLIKAEYHSRKTSSSIVGLECKASSGGTRLRFFEGEKNVVRTKQK